MAKTIYKEIVFLNGDKCEVLMPTLEDFSKMMFKYNAQLNKSCDDGYLDQYPYFMEQICLFNGQQKKLDFILKLSGDVYMKIKPVINELLNETM